MGGEMPIWDLDKCYAGVKTGPILKFVNMKCKKEISILHQGIDKKGHWGGWSSTYDPHLSKIMKHKHWHGYGYNYGYIYKHIIFVKIKVQGHVYIYVDIQKEGTW